MGELARGARFVAYEYCISLLLITFKRGSAIYFIRAGESGLAKGLPYTLISLLFGWWGLPWGPIYTIGSFVTNLQGGKDVTSEVTYGTKLDRPYLYDAEFVCRMCGYLNAHTAQNCSQCGTKLV